jgi:putative ABC transport system ATP-binding protein
MVTHDPRYADMASRKLHLLDGRILDSEGTPLSQEPVNFKQVAGH